MARKAFLLRMDPKLLEALERWAAADLRSLNGQIEYLLREALSRRGVKGLAETAEQTEPSQQNLDQPQG